MREGEVVRARIYAETMQMMRVGVDASTMKIFITYIQKGSRTFTICLRVHALGLTYSCALPKQVVVAVVERTQMDDHIPVQHSTSESDRF